MDKQKPKKCSECLNIFQPSPLGRPRYKCDICFFKKCLDCKRPLLYWRKDRTSGRCKPCQAKHRRIPAEKRFWGYVNKTDSCWFWTGGKLANGYGSFFVGIPSRMSGHIAAHRFSWNLKNKKVEKGEYLRHECGEISCVNPAHLSIKKDFKTRKHCVDCNEDLLNWRRGDERCRRCSDKNKTLPIKDRFFKYVKKSESCWNWIGETNRRYGQFHMKTPLGKWGAFRAHRISWIIHFGEIPEGLNVLHKCDNPPCVNPNHLSIGTQNDNIHDMIKKGRAKFPAKNKPTPTMA